MEEQVDQKAPESQTERQLFIRLRDDSFQDVSHVKFSSNLKSASPFLSARGELASGEKQEDQFHSMSASMTISNVLSQSQAQTHNSSEVSSPIECKFQLPSPHHSKIGKGTGKKKRRERWHPVHDIILKALGTLPTSLSKEQLEIVIPEIAEKMSKVRIPMWNRATRRMQVGTTGPTGKGLRKFLDRKPTFEILIRQDQDEEYLEKHPVSDDVLELHRRVTVINKVTGKKRSGNNAPLRCNLAQWNVANSSWVAYDHKEHFELAQTRHRNRYGNHVTTSGNPLECPSRNAEVSQIAASENTEAFKSDASVGNSLLSDVNQSNVQERCIISNTNRSNFQKTETLEEESNMETNPLNWRHYLKDEMTHYALGDPGKMNVIGDSTPEHAIFPPLPEELNLVSFCFDQDYDDLGRPPLIEGSGDFIPKPVWEA